MSLFIEKPTGRKNTAFSYVSRRHRPNSQLMKVFLFVFYEPIKYNSSFNLYAPRFKHDNFFYKNCITRTNDTLTVKRTIPYGKKKFTYLNLNSFIIFPIL